MWINGGVAVDVSCEFSIHFAGWEPDFIFGLGGQFFLGLSPDKARRFCMTRRVSRPRTTNPSALTGAGQLDMLHYKNGLRWPEVVAEALTCGKKHKLLLACMETQGCSGYRVTTPHVHFVANDWSRSTRTIGLAWRGKMAYVGKKWVRCPSNSLIPRTSRMYTKPVIARNFYENYLKRVRSIFVYYEQFMKLDRICKKVVGLSRSTWVVFVASYVVYRIEQKVPDKREAIIKNTSNVKWV